MTTQTLDWVFYQGRRYQMLSVIDQTSQMLTEWHVPRLMFSTACHRGYIANYEIDSDQLFIKRLEVADVNDSDEMIQAEIASVMEMLPSIEGVYPTAELIGHTRTLGSSEPGGKEELHPYYSIAYRLKYFYQISTQFTLLYREDKAVVGTFLMKPFPDEVLKVSVAEGHIQEIKIVTEELRVIQDGIDASYEELRRSPNRELGADHERKRNALRKQKASLLGKEF